VWQGRGVQGRFSSSFCCCSSFPILDKWGLPRDTSPVQTTVRGLVASKQGRLPQLSRHVVLEAGSVLVLRRGPGPCRAQWWGCRAPGCPKGARNCRKLPETDSVCSWLLLRLQASMESAAARMAHESGRQLHCFTDGLRLLVGRVCGGGGGGVVGCGGGWGGVGWGGGHHGWGLFSGLCPRGGGG
jgi:hypothetical protein